jgi:SAM-dependent methyltransferase
MEFPNFAAPAPVRKGAIFLCAGLESHESDEERAKLQMANEAAAAQGWRAGVDAAYGPKLLHYVDNPSRMVFIPILGLKSSDAILEIGPGLGQNAVAIAPHVSTIDVLEVVEGQAEFCALRCAEDGISNIRITAGGNDCLLPYQDAVFDGVVLNLVLEWCGNRSDGTPHEVMHQRLMSEMARVLKPGGFLYLVTKNRFSLRLLIGGRDEHLFGLRFGSAMPRWIAKLLTGGKNPPGHLHSHGALAAMMAKAGFSNVEAFWAQPEMRWPQQIIPFASPTFALDRKKSAQGETRLTRMIAPFLPRDIAKWTAPGHNFRAIK